MVIMQKNATINTALLRDIATNAGLSKVLWKDDKTAIFFVCRLRLQLPMMKLNLLPTVQFVSECPLDFFLSRLVPQGPEDPPGRSGILITESM
jgi:hypothetical protein